MHPGQLRGSREQPIEGVRFQPAAEHDLDVIDRAVGEAFDGHRHQPGAGRRGADPLEVARPVAGRQDRAQRDGRGRTARAAAGSRAGHDALAGAAGGPSRTRAIQRSGCSISPSRGNVSGPSQRRASAAFPRASAIGADEDLALLVLLELEVHPGQPEHRPLERGATRASLVEAGADLFDARHEVATDLVHDVVAEALEQAHHGLCLAEQPPLLLAHQPLHPVLAAALAAQGSSHAAHRLPAEAPDVAAEQAQLPLEARREIRPQPGVRLEFEGVGRLVEGDPRPERPEWHAEGARRLADVLLDEQQSTGCRLRRQQRDVVLAEHAPAHEAEQQARAGGS